MTVWAVYNRCSYESDLLMSLHSTEALAEESVRRLHEKFSYGSYVIEELEVNTGDRDDAISTIPKP